MKIEFHNNDSNFIFEEDLKNRLIALASIHWENKFPRECLTVLFESEDEFAWRTPTNIDGHSYGKTANPRTEWMGCYISFDRDEEKTDVVIICPDRIKNTLGSAPEDSLSFYLLTAKVFLHELAHSLTIDNPFSGSEVGVYSITSCKNIEESLCNAFAIMHFEGADKSILIDFCKNQPPGYSYFEAWGDFSPTILGVIEQWKNFKLSYGIEIQLLHSGFGIDLMTDVDTSLKNWHHDKSQSISLDIPPINAPILNGLNVLLASGNNSTKAGRLQGVVANLLKLKKINNSTPGRINIFDWRKEKCAKEIISKCGFKMVSQTNLYLKDEYLIAFDENSIFISVIYNKDYLYIFSSLPKFKLN